ncbi:MAG: hypothetical protein P8J51_04590 [Dehalococcoidia bacterium]|nr:hypothetical protein [Dehalococcoidia bacterium]
MAISKLSIDGVIYSVHVEENDGNITASITNVESKEETTYSIDKLIDKQGKKISLSINNKSIDIFIQSASGGKTVTINNVLYPVFNVTGKKKSSAGGGSADPDGVITAPLAGIVAKINVQVGDVIEAGETTCIVEAMKMQNEIKIPIKGKITSIPFEELSRVEKGDVVINYEPITS